MLQTFHLQFQILENKQSMNKESQNRPFTYKPPTNPFVQNRPQTPIGNNNNLHTHQPLNRSYSRLPQNNQNYPQYYQQNISKSRVSMSSASQLAHLNAQQNDIFPEDLVFLLSNEQKNINKMKEKIEQEKNKVENDFSIFKLEIEHILEDIKISLQAQLDLVYKTFITKYAELKGEVQEVRLMRKQILMSNQNAVGSNLNNFMHVSNKNLIDEIEKDAEHMRNFRIYGYLSELQKQKLQPILHLSSDLILIGAAECPFYRHKEMTSKLKNVKQHMGSFIKEVFDNLTDYVNTPEYLMEKEKEQQENTKVHYKEFENLQASKYKAFDSHYPGNISKTLDEEITPFMKPTKQQNNMAKKSTISTFNNQTNQQPQQPQQPQQTQNNKKALSWIANTQQTALTKWCEEIKLNKIDKVDTDHSDAILCIYFINQKYIATGSKDTTINVYSVQGKKVKTLKGHAASICCLSGVRNINGDVFLASGSDHGCCSLILWDIRSWSPSLKIQCHTAAVTAIIDLEDGRHVITGSYDKKMNLLNMVNNQIVVTLNNNRTSVTGMTMSIDKAKLVTSGLDNSLTVWNIIRKNNIVEQIVSDRVILNNSLICQIQPSILRPELLFCATRDGNIKMINIVNGEIQKSYTVNTNSLIQLVVLERQMKNDSPMVLTCSSKDSSLIMTKMDTGISSMLKLSNPLGIEYGCGIGPKIILSEYRDGTVAVLNQTNTNREFTLYELELK